MTSNHFMHRKCKSRKSCIPLRWPGPAVTKLPILLSIQLSPSQHDAPEKYRHTTIKSAWCFSVSHSLILSLSLSFSLSLSLSFSLSLSLSLILSHSLSFSLILSHSLSFSLSLSHSILSLSLSHSLILSLSLSLVSLSLRVHK